MSVHCVKCNVTNNCLDKAEYYRRRTHLREATDHRVTRNLFCDLCGEEFDRLVKMEQHACTLLRNEDVAFTTYTLKLMDSNLVQFLIGAGRPEYEVVKICVDEQWAIPNLLCASIPIGWRKGQFYKLYKSICNTNPSFFYEKVCLNFFKL